VCLDFECVLTSFSIESCGVMTGDALLLAAVCSKALALCMRLTALALHLK
jgi:hypothetical protein